MAYPGTLRRRATHERVALCPALLFYRLWTSFLVSGRPAVSVPRSLVNVARGALLDSGRCAKHDPRCDANVFGPRSVSLLSERSALRRQDRKSTRLNSSHLG